MAKRRGLMIQLTVILGFLLLTILYFVIGFCYQEGFGPGTFINGIYCTGKSVEQVNEELKKQYGKDSFSLQDAYGHTYIIGFDEIGLNIDYIGQLEDIQSAQSPYLWIMNLFDFRYRTLPPQIVLNEDLLAKALENCGIYRDNEKTQNVEILLEQGYVLKDGMTDILDKDMLKTVIIEALKTGMTEIDVSSCYVDLPYTDQMLKTLALWEKVDAFQTCGIVYDMGDAFVELTPEIVSGWIMLSEKGDFLLDSSGELILKEEGIQEFLDILCAEYTTYGSTHTFQSTRGDLITIEGGTYGNEIDRAAEETYLKQAFLSGVEEVHVPSYTREAYVRGKDDIGDTYVEVDMTEQKLYYYEDGKLLLETDVVTGNTGRRMGTPEGVNYVYSMQRNRTLRGPGYASFVKYWMPVTGNIGLHDASWRKEFGGEIYKTNGSHGCINIPPDVMPELYEMLEIGVPVVMFY
ncbi:MAG: L,D-transpeptidase [Lachnospiraceae bacterium]|nr:L,D-transpeptidase [Lachnospiraceae bacterium]